MDVEVEVTGAIAFYRATNLWELSGYIADGEKKIESSSNIE